MAEKPQPNDAADATAAPQATPGQPPRRGPGHRGTDMRDTVAEMAERAQLISQEAGSKIAGAMKDVIAAAAGLAGFAIESARDLVQYMVRRGQMTQEEADRIIRDAEEAHGKRSPEERSRPTASKIAADAAAVARAAAAAAAAANPPPYTPPPRMAPLTTGRAASQPFARPPAEAAPKPTPGKPALAQQAPRRSAPPAASKPTPKRASASSKPAPKVAARRSKPASKGAKSSVRSPAKKGSKRR